MRRREATSNGYLPLKEAANYLGVSVTKIRRLIDKGLLKPSLDPLDDRKRLVKTVDLDELRIPRPVDGKEPRDRKSHVSSERTQARPPAKGFDL